MGFLFARAIDSLGKSGRGLLLNTRSCVENHFIHKDEDGQFGMNCTLSLSVASVRPIFSQIKWLRFGYTW